MCCWTKRAGVKIAYFGLAKILGVEARDWRLTGPREVMETPHYMGLNSNKFKNFEDSDGQPALPYLLSFQPAGRLDEGK